jgi:hypothetical protein
VAYLDDNPPRRSQGEPRRGVASGGIVVHTAESGLPDISPPDSKAEGVAAFIRGRSDPGCYHVLFDSDSTVVMWDFVPMTAYHDGTGTNDFSTGMSFATNAAAWGQYPAWDEAALRQAANWLGRTFIPTMKARGVTVRLERTSVDAFRNRDPAFVGHGDLDPGRRTDPGAGFPWQRLFDLTKESMGAPAPPKPPSLGGPVMPYLFGKYTKAATIFAMFPGGEIRALGPQEWGYYRKVIPNVKVITTGSPSEYRAWRRAARK